MVVPIVVVGGHNPFELLPRALFDLLSRYRASEAESGKR
jgi:hypothetical protein